MTTEQIANTLVGLCQKGDFEEAQNELFAEDAISIEPYGTPEFDKETKGIAAIREKGKKWNDMVEELHEISVSKPVVADSSFACALRMNVTMKGGKNMDMTELCVYKVKDGKIIEEQFFM